MFQDDTYVPSFQTFEKPTKTLREIELMSAHKTRENNNILRIGKDNINIFRIRLESVIQESFIFTSQIQLKQLGRCMNQSSPEKRVRINNECLLL